MNNTDDDTEILQTFASRLFWLIFFCPFSVISLFFFYFYFYHICRHYKALFRKINNHTLLCLLITGYLVVQTELPMTIGFLIRNRVLIETKRFCIFWNYWYYVWTTMSIQFTMLTSINRYLLIFHKAFLMKYKLYCHFLPMICIWLYLPCLHLYFIVFFPYSNTTFDYSKVWCNGPQFLLVTFYVTWDDLFDTFLPTGITVLFNLLIIVRVSCLKRLSTNTASKWRKNRRMILQLTAICCSQLIASLPYCIVTLGETYGSSTFALDIYTQVLIYTFYVPSLFSPLFVMVTLPKDIRDKVPFISKCRKKKPNTLSVLRRLSAVDANPTIKDQLQSRNTNVPNRTQTAFSKMRSHRTAPETILETQAQKNN
ncbi:unnamed protein product [Adineta steineri]|uniref:G-protein coupled receptors family 1 profile domain-containing protein n=1 Tax=Adineta steineri TaxID=433720 RepID=A0A813QJ95_9BILA|nr:unnamed protein product [Adineta steineri]CAF4104756.1 unnamed protein product [Adineta steineri]